MSVALADEPGVEVVSVQQDVAKQAPVAVYGISGAVLCELHCLTFERGLGEGACLAAKVFDRLGGVLRLRGVHSHESDGVAVVLEADSNGVSVNHTFDLGRDRIELGAGNE